MRRPPHGFPRAPVRIVLSAIVWLSVLAPVRAQVEEGKEPRVKPLVPTWNEIGPLFAKSCTHCHGGERPARGLSLETVAGVRKGSRGGDVIDVATPAQSALMLRVKGEDGPRMPLDGPPYLSDAEIAAILAWIEAGLPEGPAKEAETGPAPTRKRALPGPDEPATWAHVAPIFATRCVECHKHGGSRGPAPERLELNSYEAVIRGGDRVALVAGHAAASPVVRHVRGIATPRMPLDGPPFLSEEEIRLLERWVQDGARDSGGKRAAVPRGREVRYRGVLTGPSEIDGIRIVVDARTRIDKNPRVGRPAEVRGIVQEDGSILATRIRPR